MSAEQYRPKWLLPIGCLILCVGLAFLMYLVLMDVDTDGKEFLIVAILSLVVGGAFSFMGGDIIGRTKASEMTDVQLAKLSSFVPYLSIKGGIAGFLFVFIMGIISYVDPTILQAIAAFFFPEKPAAAIPDVVTENPKEVVEKVIEAITQTAEEVVQYQPPILKSGYKNIGF